MRLLLRSSLLVIAILLSTVVTLVSVGCGSSTPATPEDSGVEDTADDDAAADDTGTEVAAPSINLLRVDTSCSGVATSSSGTFTGVACTSGSPTFGVFQGTALRLTDPLLGRIIYQVDQQVAGTAALELE